MRRLVLLRHGQTAWNAERRFQGQADVALDEVGLAQAAAVAPVMAAMGPSVLVSSDLSRAAQTMEYVAEETQLVPSLDPRLREIEVGAFQGLLYREVVERFGPGPWDFAEHGGESEPEVADRVAAVLGEVAELLDDGQTAVLAAHGAAIRFGVHRFLGWPIDVLGSLGSLSNCGWVELTDAAPMWFGASSWRLAAYNRVAIS